MKWDPLDQSRAVSLLAQERREKNETCNGCGTRTSDYFDPETKRELRNPPWKVHVESCPGCRMLHDARENVSSDDSSFTHVYLVPEDPDGFDLAEHVDQ